VCVYGVFVCGVGEVCVYVCVCVMCVWCVCVCVCVCFGKFIFCL